MATLTDRGIDTIQLYTDSFNADTDILCENKFNTTIYFNDNGVAEQKYFINKPYETNNKKSSSYAIEILNNRVVFRCSIPRYLNKSNNNTILATKDNLLEFRKELHNELFNNGIKCNVDTMNISRVDITNNALMNYNTTEYIEMFKNFNIKGIKENGKSIYNTTFSVRNSNKGITIYDKENEINHKIISNKLRNEINFFRNTNIKKILGVGNLDTLTKDFNSVCKKAKEYEKLIMFNQNNLIELKDKYQNETIRCIKALQQLHRIKKYENENKNILAELTDYFSIKELLKINDNIDNIVNTIMNTLCFDKDTTKRQYRYRTKLELIDKYNFFKQVAQNERQITYTELFNECITKLVA